MDPSQFKVCAALIGLCIVSAVLFHIVHVRITWKRYMTYVCTIVYDAVELYHTSLQDKDIVAKLVHILGADSRLCVAQQMMQSSEILSHTGVDVVELSVRVKDSRYRHSRLLRNYIMYNKQSTAQDVPAVPVHGDQFIRR